jgi:hypothetical protein
MSSITNWFKIFRNHRKLKLDGLLKFLDQIVFRIVNHFHRSHLNQIHAWRELNRTHSHSHHSSQWWHQEIFNSLDRTVFLVVHHFCRSHLNQIHSWHELNRLHFQDHHFNQSWFQEMLKFLDWDVFSFCIILINHIWIRFTLDTNWIGSIFIFIISINVDSTQCWKSWIEMFFILSVTFICFVWSKFTFDTNWIICIFIFTTSIDVDSKKCSIDRWFCILWFKIVVDLDWKWFSDWSCPSQIDLQFVKLIDDYNSCFYWTF